MKEKEKKISPFAEQSQVFFAQDLAVLLYDKPGAIGIINSQINPKWRIRQATIDAWFAGEKPRSPQLVAFEKKYDEAKMQEKLRLMQEMLKSEKAWQKYSWLLERLCPAFRKKENEKFAPVVNFSPKKWEIVTEKPQMETDI